MKASHGSAPSHAYPAVSTDQCDVLIGDNLDVLAKWPSDSIDLTLTSPPYARLHRETAVDPGRYVQWLLPRAKELLRVLRPTGSFVLNIAPAVVNGEEHPFLDDLIAALRRDIGFRLVQRCVWVKPDAMPGDFGRRLKPAWEYVLHLAKTADYWWQDAEVRTPYQSRPHGGKPKSRLRDPGARGRDFYRAGGALPPNYFTWPSAGTRDGAGDHSAVFPIELPAFFIRSCCPLDGTVLDCFAGSGTTGVAALALGRRVVLIEKNPEHEALIRRRLSQAGDPAIAARLSLPSEAMQEGPQLFTCRSTAARARAARGGGQEQ